MLNKFILNLNIRAKNSPHCAGRGNHCISFPVCNICFWKGLTHWSYCQKDAEVQIRQQPPSPPSESTFSCSLIIEETTKNFTSKLPSYVCRILSFHIVSVKNFFKGWWHLVAFTDHYTHLYEIVRHQLSNTIELLVICV